MLQNPLVGEIFFQWSFERFQEAWMLFIIYEFKKKNCAGGKHKKGKNIYSFSIIVTIASSSLGGFALKTQPLDLISLHNDSLSKICWLKI